VAIDLVHHNDPVDRVVPQGTSWTKANRVTATGTDDPIGEIAANLRCDACFPRNEKERIPGRGKRPREFRGIVNLEQPHIVRKTGHGWIVIRVPENRKKEWMGARQLPTDRIPGA
jgi:hypothetical protein